MPVNPMTSSEESLADQVIQAYRDKQPLRIVGGGSKSALGHTVTGTDLCLNHYQGIINYEPSELVITARAGTPLHIIEATLAEQGQMLGFEPPRYNNKATLGGTIACGLSGPRRPYSGAARDFVLGCRMINGKGERLNFGGQVMKNVAGYDVSRLMCGAQGTLGVLLDISLKVVPRPQLEQTLSLECDETQARTLLNNLGLKPLPISATCYQDGQLCIRLSGSESAVMAAAQFIGGEQQIGGEQLSGDEALTGREQLWQQLREQQLPIFKQPFFWRLSLPPATGPLPKEIVEQQVIEWGGAQRWITSQADPETVWNLARSLGGHGTRYGTDESLRQPLEPGLFKLSQQLRTSFDPERILNPGRLYPTL
ncbi:glycolate oxidase subunit GlcE [Oceanospirillum beijerinckii]|uniref:glycolate oxidase subunit GlcE n=1 Tax=Oceanospirillum beijerinckii TaxID=64976 RepID=UPI00040E75C2|nr:glycolate oxidase subunit GlcE [Oceanospirillum beijerinckii]